MCNKLILLATAMLLCLGAAVQTVQANPADPKFPCELLVTHTHDMWKRAHSDIQLIRLEAHHKAQYKDSVCPEQLLTRLRAVIKSVHESIQLTKFRHAVEDFVQGVENVDMGQGIACGAKLTEAMANADHWDKEIGTMEGLLLEMEESCDEQKWKMLKEVLIDAAHMPLPYVQPDDCERFIKPCHDYVWEQQLKQKQQEEELHKNRNKPKKRYTRDVGPNGGLASE